MISDTSIITLVSHLYHRFACFLGLPSSYGASYSALRRQQTFARQEIFLGQCWVVRGSAASGACPVCLCLPYQVGGFHPDLAPPLPPHDLEGKGLFTPWGEGTGQVVPLVFLSYRAALPRPSFSWQLSPEEVHFGAKNRPCLATL